MGNRSVVYYLKKTGMSASILILCLFSFMNAHGQALEVGGWLGTSNYFGDLNRTMSFEYTRPGGGFFVRYNLDYRFAVKGGLNYGRVGFEDQMQEDYAYHQARNLSFRSDVFEITGQIEFNFLKFVKGDRQHSFTPYLLTGISLFTFNPEAKYQGEWVDLQRLATEDKRYPTVSGAVPIGGGFKYAITDEWTIGVEGGLRKTFTDFLDDVSDEYENIRTTANPKGEQAKELADRSDEVGEPIGKEGKQRGNVLTNDEYLFVGFTLSYTLRQVRCPNPSAKY
jgi:opacity protein-like surface antigen